MITMLKRELKKPFDVFIIDLIENLFSIPTCRNKTQISQYPQLMRDSTLTKAGHLCQVRNTGLPLQKDRQKPQARAVTQPFKGRGNQISSV